MPIRLLSEDVAARIAAGEVVERPASVVKELLENSLDAGATEIQVETREGGKSLLRVQDNGAGIPANDVELAFRRHATSKIETAEDLQRIATLGFRGEALASIASVSRITCTTRHREEMVGTRLRIEGGAVIARSPNGRAPGTDMHIQDLFYNVPARRKFLQTEKTERRHIDSFLTRYAIAYPEVAFQVVHDGREILRTAGGGSVAEALISVYGLDLGGSLLAIPPALTHDTPIKVSGFVGPTTVHRANRGYITLFINGRWIQDLRTTYAIIQAYHTLLPVNRYPVAFVLLEMPPEDVDVNVHPAKTEVRFRDGDTVFRAVQRAVRSAVIEMAPVTATWQPPNSPEAVTTGDAPHPPKIGLATLKPAPLFSPETQGTPPRTASGQNAAPLLSRDPGAETVGTLAASGDAPPQIPPLRVLGQASTMFIVAEGPDGLYLIDQHAAHERVLYERLLGDWMQGEVQAQALLDPVSVTLPADEAAQLESQLDTLARLGLQVESFGPNTFLVRSTPALLGAISPQALLADIAATGEEQRSPVREGLEARTVRRICKRVAIKAGQVLAREEMEQLVHELERCRNPRTCPHGRPTLLKLSVEQLASQFERT
ncbi:MAG: DNA mismatch repair endonuclease MutL [Anaerolineae bacterium]|nr:DNA mismatch repair endonuclease MutL [Anaerolineae bacterium]